MLEDVGIVVLFLVGKVLERMLLLGCLLRVVRLISNPTW